MSRLMHSGRTLVILITLVCITTVSSVLLIRSIALADDPDPDPDPDPRILATALHRVGLSAEHLTAAGLDTTAVRDVISRAEASFATRQASIESADAALGNARNTADTLRARIRAGIAPPEEIQNYSAAQTSLATAQAQRDAELEAFFDDATEGLSVDISTTLQRMHANTAHRVPVEFTVTDRTDAQWHALRKALANEHVASRLEIDADSGMQTLLTQERGGADVASAAANLTANRNTINAVWDYEVGL